MNSQLAETAANAVSTASNGGIASRWPSIANLLVVLIALASAVFNQFSGHAEPTSPDSNSPLGTSSTGVLPGSQFVAARAAPPRLPNEGLAGRVISLGETPVIAKTPGRVQRLLVTSGQQVNAGATLLVLENDSLRNEAANAKRSVADARRNLKRLTLRIRQENAESQVALVQARNAHEDSLRTFDNDTAMYKRGFVSQQRLRNSREREERMRLSFETRVQREITSDASNALHVEECEMKLHRAEQRLYQIESDLEGLTITSPESGIVEFETADASFEIGNSINPWMTVARVHPIDSLYLEIAAPTNNLDVGDDIEVRVAGIRFRTRTEKVRTAATRFALAPIPADVSQLAVGQAVVAIRVDR